MEWRLMPWQFEWKLLNSSGKWNLSSGKKHLISYFLPPPLLYMFCFVFLIFLLFLLFHLNSWICIWLTVYSFNVFTWSLCPISMELPLYPAIIQMVRQLSATSVVTIQFNSIQFNSINWYISNIIELHWKTVLFLLFLL